MKMTFITTDGELVEGILLSEEEIEIAEKLPNEMSDASPDYISMRVWKKVVSVLLSKYKLTKRTLEVEVPPEEIQENYETPDPPLDSASASPSIEI